MAGALARSGDTAGPADVNLAVIGTVFAVIFIGELPDKTMVAAVVMSAKGRAFAVWLGAAGAF
ncbi:MAG: TMEM165/GDT1 family protein, partial [Actinobacteria bacterium]|nr:TMEM165/GDT1 family protein [Actinomycetota bacterium]